MKSVLFRARRWLARRCSFGWHANARTLLVLAASFCALATAHATDTTPPTLVSLDFNPKSVDVSSAAQTITVTAHITDDSSGVSYTQIYFNSPSLADQTSASFSLASGTATDGTYQASVTIPKGAEPGTWKLFKVVLQDTAGNNVGYGPDAGDTPLPGGTPTNLSVTDTNPDTTAPVLVSIDFTPKSVDVSSTAQNVTVTAQLTDDSSGVQYAQVYFNSPSNAQQVSFFLGLTSGTATAGTFADTESIPAGAEPGTWKLTRVQLQDAAGNFVNYGPAFSNHFPNGTPTDLSVTSTAPDTTPPTLVSLDFTPKTVDVTNAAQTVTVTAHLTDDNTGVNSAVIYFSSPSSAQTAFASFSLTSGTATDGTYTASVTIPQGAEPGTWKIYRVSLQDTASNSVEYGPNFARPFPSGMPTDLSVLNANVDTTAPTLVSLSFTPQSVDVSSAAQTITVTAHITDDMSGVQHAEIYFSSPSNAQHAMNSFALTAGTATDGTYQATITIPKSAEAGTWKLTRVNLLDQASNSVDYGPSYPTQFPGGTPTDLSVTSTTADTAPPVLVSLDFTPKSVNVSNSSQTVIVTAHFTDDNSGVQFATVYFLSPSQAQHVSTIFTLSSGTATNGTFQASVTIPQSAEMGTWTIFQVFLQDTAGNSISYGPSFSAQLPSGTPTDLSVTNVPPSPTPTPSPTATPNGSIVPTLVSFDFTPAAVNVSTAGQSLTVTAHIVDSTSDVQIAAGHFTSPSGAQSTDVNLILLSGTVRDGSYQGTLTIPKGAEAGTWTLSRVLLQDAANNVANYGSSSAPFPNGIATDLAVTSIPVAQPLNISTRMQVLTADNVPIAGFFITGPAHSTKKVMIRGLGPSLAAAGVTNPLSDPLLELHGPIGSFNTITNDNWADAANASDIPPGFQPSDPRESVIVATLPIDSTGLTSFTGIVRGAHGETGVGLVEAYDLDTSASAFANISTRGFVDTADNVMIGGFILGGNNQGSRVLIRAIGPSLPVDGALADPTLEIHDGQGNKIASNDNWKIDDSSGQSQEAAIAATTIPPPNDLESAILQTFAPGAYTAIVAGKNGGVGVGLVEVYNLQ
jgi:hypothetical protein